MTTATARRRREREIIGLLVVILIVVGFAAFRQNVVNGNLKDQQAATQRQADASHNSQLNGCQQGNKKLRRVINQRIVAPIRAVLRENGAPEEQIDLFSTVPYAICGHLYPEHGDPISPFYRLAPLPPLRKPTNALPTEKSAPSAPAAPQSDGSHDSNGDRKKPADVGGSDGVSGGAGTGTGSTPTIPDSPDVVDDVDQVVNGARDLICTITNSAGVQVPILCEGP